MRDGGTIGERGGPGAGPGGGPGTVWVRRCEGCGSDDRRAAFGAAVVAVADDPWSRCPGCGHPGWRPVPASFDWGGPLTAVPARRGGRA